MCVCVFIVRLASNLLVSSWQIVCCALCVLYEFVCTSVCSSLCVCVRVCVCVCVRVSEAVPLCSRVPQCLSVLPTLTLPSGSLSPTMHQFISHSVHVARPVVEEEDRRRQREKN